MHGYEYDAVTIAEMGAKAGQLVGGVLCHRELIGLDRLIVLVLIDCGHDLQEVLVPSLVATVRPHATNAKQHTACST
jgi:hypothetical protein